MAGTQRSSAMQFKDLTLWGKVAFVVAGCLGVAAGFLLPKWITVPVLAALFLGAFLIQKLSARD